jgi:colanic acid/amylovoran biosynthesis glycosyltransferase
MKLAYLTGQYPKVSHTFVRREILGLEALGHQVIRLSVREADSGVVDPLDIEELDKTHVFFDASPVQWIGAFVCAFARTPIGVLKEIAAIAKKLRAPGPGITQRFAYLLEATYFLSLARRGDVEHVHAHFGRNAASVAMIMKNLGGPTFSMTVHGPDEFDDTMGHELGAKVVASAFTAAISHYTTAQLRRWVPLEHWNKLEVIHCSVDESFFEDCEPIFEDCTTFTCVGRLCPQKGQLILLDAFAALLKEGRDAKLVLAGDGEMRPEVEARMRELGIEGHVSITGWISEREVRAQLKGSRCMVLPSFAEGLPVVIMEAFAMGRPVISTYIAGIPELVRESANGWLVAAGDTAALTTALREALDCTPSELDSMGHEGSKRVREQHFVQTEVSKLEALLTKATSNR